MKYIFFFSTLFTANLLSAQYTITLKIKNLPPQKVQFAYYFEDKQYVVSERESNAKGEVVFKGEENLPRGIYLVAFSVTNAFFDLLITDEQVFELKTDTVQLIENMRVKGSTENSLFFEHQKQMLILRKQISDIEKNAKLDSLEKSNKIENLDSVMKVKQETFITEHPSAFLTKLLLTLEAPANETDMWSGVDLSESGLIRTPFFVNIVRTHIARHIDKGADYINFENDRLLSKVSKDTEMYDYLTRYFLNFYRTHFKAGMNKVFVHIADTYFLNGHKPDITPEFETIITEQRDIFKSSFIGEIAKNVKFASLSGDSVSLYEIEEDAIFLYFWSTSCGHCKKATEALRVHFEHLENARIAVVAVNTNETNLPELHRYMKDNPVPWGVYTDIEHHSRFREYYYVTSAPMAYFIDQNYVIRAELQGEEQIRLFLEKLK